MTFKDQLEDSFGPQYMSDVDLERSLHATNQIAQHKRRVRSVVAGGAATIVLITAGVAFAMQNHNRDEIHVVTRPGRTSVTLDSPTSTAPTTVTAIPAQDGDVDGDGKVDVVTLVTHASTTTVNADLTKLGRQSVDVSLDGVPTGLPPEVMGVVDADGDGHAEIFVNEGGADGFTAHLVQLVADRLVVVTADDGTPFTMAVASPLQFESTFRCLDVSPQYTGKEILSLDAGNDGVTSDGTITVFALTNGKAKMVSQKQSKKISEPSLSDASRALLGGPVQCGSLK